MRFTEKWVWGRQNLIGCNRYRSVRNDAGERELLRVYHDIRKTRMGEYRERVRAIDTDEKASQAIRDYWHMVAREWNDEKGVNKRAEGE